MCWELIAIFNLLKIIMRVDIFGTKKCKVFFGRKYSLEMAGAQDNQDDAKFQIEIIHDCMGLKNILVQGLHKPCNRG